MQPHAVGHRPSGREAWAVSRTSPASGEGAVKSLEADGLRRPLEALSCAGKISSSLARLVASSADRAGSLGQVAGSGRWFATTPAHPLAVAVQKRINPEAVLQGGCPPQSPRLPEPFWFLTQMCARFSPSRSAAPWEEGADALVPANQR